MPGNAEADIRRALVRKGCIKGIVGQPANLFFGSGIPACIILIDKQDAQGQPAPTKNGFPLGTLNRPPLE